MANPRAAFLADILVEHAEELEFLWGQRLVALDDPAYLFGKFLDLEERIEAHAEGLLVRGENLAELLGPGLAAKEATAVFASAYPLLRTGRPECVEMVVEAFKTAKGGALDGLCQALCHGPAVAVPMLREASKSAEAPLALAALEALAFQSPADCDAEGLAPFMDHKDPITRRFCWRIVARLKTPLIPQRYKKAIEDADPLVRTAAYWAAAWGRQPWLVDHCRTVLKSPKSQDFHDALHVLAVLGKPEDLPFFRKPPWSGVPSPAWFKILSAFGHPGVIPELLKGMEDPNPRTALAAGEAFSRVTGCAVASEKRVTLPPEDGSTPDEFDREFLDEAFLPDPAKARAFVKTNKDALTKGTRWHLGRELARETARSLLDAVDVPMRRETCLRARFEGRWPVGLVDLERFPQRPAD